MKKSSWILLIRCRLCILLGKVACLRENLEEAPDTDTTKDGNR
jgi:hypothetical protein